eukprot:11850868-Alexandrium_andersonii.AAC.1
MPFWTCGPAAQPPCRRPQVVLAHADGRGSWGRAAQRTALARVIQSAVARARWNSHVGTPACAMILRISGL